MKYRLEESNEVSKILKNQATELDTAKTYMQARSAVPKIGTMSEDRALSLFANAQLTKY